MVVFAGFCSFLQPHGSFSPKLPNFARSNLVVCNNNRSIGPLNCETRTDATRAAFVPSGVFITSSEPKCTQTRKKARTSADMRGIPRKKANEPLFGTNQIFEGPPNGFRRKGQRKLALQGATLVVCFGFSRWVVIRCASLCF